MDAKWWEIYYPEVEKEFTGERVSSEYKGKVNSMGQVPNFCNSGAAILTLAASRGATKIIMVGYDCQKTNGQAHHHGDHPKGLGNAGSVGKWPDQFKKASAYLQRKGVKVLNASRVTLLTCFERVPLDNALSE